MEVVYIAGPYRDTATSTVCENIQEARHYAVKFWRLGYAVICPHLNTAHMENEIPGDTIFLSGDMELLRRSDIVVMMPEWIRSQGATEEHRLAVNLGKKVIYE